MIALMLLGFAAVALLEAPRLVRQRYWRELIAFTVLLVLGLALSILIALDVPLPPVSTSIHNFIKALFKLSDSFAMP